MATRVITRAPKFGGGVQGQVSAPVQTLGVAHIRHRPRGDIRRRRKTPAHHVHGALATAIDAIDRRKIVGGDAGQRWRIWPLTNATPALVANFVVRPSLVGYAHPMGKVISTILLFCCLLLSGVGNAAQPTTGRLPACVNKCVNGMAEILAPSGSQCDVAYAIPCFPNECDAQGLTCRVARCLSNHDCSPGAACNQADGRCTPISYFCPDPWTVEAASGSKESCSPYKCKAGSCVSACSGVGDCYPGYQCTAGRCTK